MGIIDEALEKTGTYITDTIQYWFNTEFWGLVGWTGLIAAACFGLGYFFQFLRPFLGAILMSVIAMWFGYHKGQKSLEKKKNRE